MILQRHGRKFMHHIWNRMLLGLCCSGALCISPASAGTVVQFRTELGDLEVELYDVEKPVTVENFLKNVTEGVYESSFIHELVPGAIAFGGKIRVSNTGETNLPITRPAITNEFHVGPRLKNLAGTLAMETDSPDPNSATTRFSINLKDNPERDGSTNGVGSVVFGRVIRGTEVVDKLKLFKPAISMQENLYFAQSNCVLEISPVFVGFPIYGFIKRSVGVYSLRIVNVDITLLSVRVSRDEDGRTRVRWNPVYGRTNTVEFTDVFPPIWQKLAEVPPASIPTPVYAGSGIPSPGNPLNLPAVIVDSDAAPGRFYRVRATY